MKEHKFSDQRRLFYNLPLISGINITVTPGNYAMEAISI